MPPCQFLTPSALASRSAIGPRRDDHIRIQNHAYCSLKITSLVM
jgi:hypothetical protein